jgi:acetyl-CoA acyltransferase 2
VPVLTMVMSNFYLQIDPKLIDSAVFGNVAQTSTDAAYIARHVALRSGARVDSIALTVNRLCGSGFQAVISAAFELQNGEGKIALAGGTLRFAVNNPLQRQQYKVL